MTCFSCTTDIKTHAQDIQNDLKWFKQDHYPKWNSKTEKFFNGPMCLSEINPQFQFPIFGLDDLSLDFTEITTAFPVTLTRIPTTTHTSMRTHTTGALWKERYHYFQKIQSHRFLVA